MGVYSHIMKPPEEPCTLCVSFVPNSEWLPPEVRGCLKGLAVWDKFTLGPHLFSEGLPDLFIDQIGMSTCCVPQAPTVFQEHLLCARCYPKH